MLRREAVARTLVWRHHIYIWTWERLYLATVVISASRRVVGCNPQKPSSCAPSCSDALNNAVAARDPAPGVVFHADRGCQYTSGDYATLADDLAVRLSTGSTGHAGTTRSPSRSSPP